MTKTYAHEEVASNEVAFAFRKAHGKAGFAKAARVVSGLLKSAAARGEIKRVESLGRMTGCVVYEMTEAQVEAIRAAAIARI